MSDFDATWRAGSGDSSLLAQPVRLTLVALVVLGAFEVGRLLAGVPWLAQALLGNRRPLMVGEFDLLRIGIEVVAIALGVGLAALIAIPFVKVISRR